jgi:hypothetical protein
LAEFAEANGGKRGEPQPIEPDRLCTTESPQEMAEDAQICRGIEVEMRAVLHGKTRAI